MIRVIAIANQESCVKKTSLVKAVETSVVGKSIYEHDSGGKVSKAYKQFTKEVITNA